MADDRWLPPDQIPTRKWPVVGERGPARDAPADADWVLDLAGERWTLDALRGLGLEAFTADVHCVTRWSHRQMAFAGVRLGSLLPASPARFVRFEAWSGRGHDTSLPASYARAHAWLILEAQGAPLSRAHGGPLRVFTEGRYFYKSLKWLRRVELLEEDALGYWEREDGYHNGANPWPGDERYVSGSLTAPALEALKGAIDLSRWRGRTVRSVDLSGWRPASADLSGVALKNCDLRGAKWAGLNLRGANLTLCDLRGADLRGADLRGADLEGARLAGADLSGADLRDAALTATSFEEGDQRARLDGARLEGVTGLLEAAAAFVAARNERS